MKRSLMNQGRTFGSAWSVCVCVRIGILFLVYSETNWMVLSCGAMLNCSASAHLIWCQFRGCVMPHTASDLLSAEQRQQLWKRRALTTARVGKEAAPFVSTHPLGDPGRALPCHASFPSLFQMRSAWSWLQPLPVLSETVSHSRPTNGA